jgi:hypothetical protein
MTDDEFWIIIEQSRAEFDPSRRSGNMAIQSRRLKQALLQLPISEVVAFSGIFSRRFHSANRWDLVAAAEIIFEGCCCDDGFMDFRDWLISMGRQVYENALANPDSLAIVIGAPGI